jgi:putative ABC transport system permease protein
MAAQIRQIGMMKAIGGTRAQVAQIYFSQALLLGLAAVAIAVPFGMLGARALCRYLAVFLNFDIGSFAVPLWVYLLVALVGIATPLLSAAFPVWKGSGISVLAALSDFGVSEGGFGQDPLDRALTRASGVSRPLLLALRNSFRRRTRLVLTLTTLSAGGVFFMSALNVRASMINTLDHMFASRRFDLSINLGNLYPVEAIERAISGTPGALGSEAWMAAEGSLVAAGEGSAPATHAGAAARNDGDGSTEGGVSAARSRFPLLGIQPGSRLLQLEITEGRDLQIGDVDALVANTALVARNPGIRVGQPLVLRVGPAESSFRVVGISREALSPPVGYVSRNYFEQKGDHKGVANTARVALARTDAASIDRFREALDRRLEAEGIRALSATSKADSRIGFDQHMLMIYIFLIVMSVIIGLVGGLGLMTTMSLNVLERRREMGVLRAIGASSRVVWFMVVSEGLVVGMMSFGIAAVVARPLSRGLGDFLSTALFQGELNFLFDLDGLCIWFVASMALSALASFIPAWTASRAPVREALSFE